MATLQIEHGNTDLTTWKGAFDRFEPADSGGPPRPSTGLPAAEPKGRVDEPGTRPFPGKNQRPNPRGTKAWSKSEPLLGEPARRRETPAAANSRSKVLPPHS